MLATIVQFAGVHYFTKRGYGEEMQTLPEDSDDDEDLYQNYNNLHTVSFPCKSPVLHISLNKKPNTGQSKMFYG